MFENEPNSLEGRGENVPRTRSDALGPGSHSYRQGRAEAGQGGTRPTTVRRPIDDETYAVARDRRFRHRDPAGCFPSDELVTTVATAKN